MNDQFGNEKCNTIHISPSDMMHQQASLFLKQSARISMQEQRLFYYNSAKTCAL
jgi:hypothetical protein